MNEILPNYIISAFDYPKTSSNYFSLKHANQTFLSAFLTKNTFAWKLIKIFADLALVSNSIKSDFHSKQHFESEYDKWVELAWTYENNGGC